MKKYPNINARAVLKRHNRWRKAPFILEGQDPNLVGDALDLIILEHEEMERSLNYVAHNGLRAWQNQRVAMECLDKIKNRKGQHGRI
jgi:hypothetical protein